MKALAEKEAQAFKPAVCDPRAARLTLRESNPGQGAQSLFYTTMPRGLALNGKKRLYRTSDWAWKGFAGIKNTMRNTPLTPQPNPQPNPQTTPPINETPQITIKRHLFPSSWAKKPLKPRCLAIVRLRPTESTALAMKEATSSQHEEPTHKKPLKPVCLAIVRLRPTQSTALAMKESHLFPTWWANPQKTSETSVFGNSAAST